jgi:hypothetical protein
MTEGGQQMSPSPTIASITGAAHEPTSGRGTSTSNLNALRPSHQRILDAFIAHGTMTPDELAEKINRSVFYTRPRCSELRAMGLLHTTGEVRRNAQSGLKAGVLSL